MLDGAGVGSASRSLRSDDAEEGDGDEHAGDLHMWIRRGVE